MSELCNVDIWTLAVSHGAFTHAADRTCPDLSFDPRLGEKHEPSISLFFKKSVTMSLASY